MCRSLSEGGRRCPCQSNPEYRKKLNERRRALRKAKKLGLPPLPLEHGRILSRVENLEKLSSGHNNVLGDEYRNHTTSIAQTFSDAYHRQIDNDEEVIVFGNDVSYTSEQQEIGVYTTRNTGALVDKGFVVRDTVHGVVDKSKLHEESYKDFGFDSNLDKYQLPSDHDKRTNSILSATEIELAQGDSSSSEFRKKTDSLTMYTGRYYVEINESLYDKEVTYIDEDSMTVDDVSQAVNNLDGLLDSSSRYQKIVYRGMKSSSGAFSEYESKIGEDTIQKWIDDKQIQVGSDFTFDAYTSATNNVETASSFSLAKGPLCSSLVFEILTSEGMNVSSRSIHGSESEVLLPRGCKYVVVGKHKKPKEQPGDFLHVLQLVAVDDDYNVLDGVKKYKPKKAHWDKNGKYYEE